MANVDYLLPKTKYINVIIDGRQTDRQTEEEQRETDIDIES